MDPPRLRGADRRRHGPTHGIAIPAVRQGGLRRADVVIQAYLKDAEEDIEGTSIPGR